MDTYPLPWDIHPGLTADRLIIVGQHVAAARNSAVDDYQPKKGDGPWSLGCTAYQRTLNIFGDLAVKQAYPWLTMVARKGLHFTFGVGGVPFRHFRDRGRGPSKRTLVTTLPEREALQHALFDVPKRAMELERFFRIAYATGPDGRVVQVAVLRFDKDGEIYCNWPIPVEGSTLQVLGLDAFREEGVELPPPPIGEKKRGEDNVNNTDSARAATGSAT